MFANQFERCIAKIAIQKSGSKLFPDLHIGVITRAGKKVRIFEPSFVYCIFKAKFFPSKLRCHAHFNVCTCALLQSKRVVKNVGVFKKS